VFTERSCEDTPELGKVLRQDQDKEKDCMSNRRYAIGLAAVALALAACSTRDYDFDLDTAARAARATTEQCYVAADTGDLLLVVDKEDPDPATNTTVVGPFGELDVEAIAIDPTTDRLYGASNNRLGTINVDTGQYTQVGQTFGSGSGSLGELTFFDVDGLSFDPQSGELFGVVRFESLNDLLIRIDKTTGAAIPDAFGPNVDYVEITGTRVDVDDIAIDLDGTMYGIANDNGLNNELVAINKLTGVATLIGANNVEELEGLGFDPTGQLWVSSGISDTNLDGVYPIDKANGTVDPAALVSINQAGAADFEGVACLIADDSDGDGIGNVGEPILGTDPNDADTDDDGIADGAEPAFDRDTDGDGLINARDPDSDNDGVRDGTETGVTTPLADTDVDTGNFVPDADPATTTDPLDPDTDDGGVDDGAEDTNKDGRVDNGEIDPNDGGDDAPPQDSDNDGVTDDEEDREGSDPLDADTDDDGVLDGDEHNWNLDTDGDGLINVLDPDSDNEGLTDGLERGVTDAERHADTDVGAGNFVPDLDDGTTTSQLVADTDNGGVSDFAEDPNGNGRTDGNERDPNYFFDDDPAPADSDGDGLTDAEETTVGSDPDDADTDDDGTLDGDEHNWSVDTDGDGLINVLDPDSDNDGLTDGTEQGVTQNERHPDTSVPAGNFSPDLDDDSTTFPLLPDTDDGGVPDGNEDTNHNGRIDPGERDPNDPADDGDLPGPGIDTDEDGIDDVDEITAGTDPNDADTDDDGVVDGEEPGWNQDIDGDGAINARDPDSDDDGLFDGTELGVTEPNPHTDTDAGNFVPDEDPASTTDPQDRDTDRGGVFDGVEDTNHNGRIDPGERDPNNPVDDRGAIDDRDGDGVPDDQDNCPDDDNADQDDDDNDGRGNACDDDTGFDGNWRVTGGGCSAAPGSAGVDWAFVLGLAALCLLLGRRPRRRGVGLLGLLVGCATLAGVAGAGSAHAQTQPISGNFTLERFRIAADRDGVLDVEWGGTLQRGKWDLGVWLGASDDPLVVVGDMADGEERIGRLVDHRVGGHLVATLGILDFLQAGLELPVIISQDQSLGMSPVGMADLTRFGMGDLRLIPKLRLLDAARHGVNLSIIPAFTLPTSTSDEDYFGEPRSSFAPELAISRAFGAVRVAGNFGYRTRKPGRLANLEINDELFARLGAGYRFGHGGGLPLELDVTLAAATRADDFLGDASNDYVELHSGLQYLFARPLLGFVAGGVGLNEGFGAPDFRVLLGARFGTGDGEPTRLVTDADGDGLADDQDECPTQPETRNELEDSDGCPDEADSDGDGLVDSKDECPKQPEDMDTFEDENGCPEPDNDDDGLADVSDHCPEEPEDVDAFEDENGCPDPDNDGDTVLDTRDECPEEPGPTDNHGCPDPDRDGDAVVDRLDNCPDEAGDPANHGCKRKQLVAITQDRIELIDRVYFRTNRDIIQPRSFALLDNVATVLQSHPGVRVRIEGHTDDRGDDGYNKDLSQRRANAVVRYLVKKGVDAGRLEAVGYGEEKPLQSNDTEEGRAANRRVDFNIIGAEGASIRKQDSGPTQDTIDDKSDD
jgi:outer membrane protein OmpA-like peptidoglycan-associated protein